MPGYESQQMGDAMEISTTPEKVPAPWLLVAIPGGLLVLIALSTGFIYGVLAAGFVYGAMYLLMHSKQATQYRTPAQFIPATTFCCPLLGWPSATRITSPAAWRTWLRTMTR
jgi:hypothetical protein